MTMGDDKSVEDILDHYANQVHVGIGHAAYHRSIQSNRPGFPWNLVELREIDGKWIGETAIKFQRLNGKTGCLVRVIDDTDTSYYSILEESIKPCVHQIVTNTDYLIKDVGDEYDESFEYNKWEMEVEIEDERFPVNDFSVDRSVSTDTADFGSTD